MSHLWEHLELRLLHQGGGYRGGVGHHHRVDVTVLTGRAITSYKEGPSCVDKEPPPAETGCIGSKRASEQAADDLLCWNSEDARALADELEYAVQSKEPRGMSCVSDTSAEKQESKCRPRDYTGSAVIGKSAHARSGPGYWASACPEKERERLMCSVGGMGVIRTVRRRSLFCATKLFSA